MDIKGKKLLVIGGAGLIGSHVVEELLKTDVAKVVVYDNFCRGLRENLQVALRDARVEIFPLGGDVLHADILDVAVKQVDVPFSIWRRCGCFIAMNTRNRRST
jgi:UDP-glucose 4-epimerase